MRSFLSEIVRDDGEPATIMWSWSEHEQCAYMLEAWSTKTGMDIPIMSFTDHETARFVDFIGALDPFPPHDF